HLARLRTAADVTRPRLAVGRRVVDLRGRHALARQRAVGDLLGPVVVHVRQVRADAARPAVVRATTEGDRVDLLVALRALLRVVGLRVRTDLTDEQVAGLRVDGPAPGLLEAHGVDVRVERDRLGLERLAPRVVVHL